jgi:hypothetical protein
MQRIKIMLAALALALAGPFFGSDVIAQPTMERALTTSTALIGTLDMPANYSASVVTASYIYRFQ